VDNFGKGIVVLIVMIVIGIIAQYLINHGGPSDEWPGMAAPAASQGRVEHVVLMGVVETETMESSSRAGACTWIAVLRARSLERSRKSVMP